MSKQVELKGITLRVGDSTITLSEIEARQMFDELSKLFGPTITIQREYYPIPTGVFPPPKWDKGPRWPTMWCESGLSMS